MFSPTEEARSTLDAIAEEAQRGLRERPSISIRTRLSIGFLLWLVLSLGITVISIRHRFSNPEPSFTFSKQPAATPSRSSRQGVSRRTTSCITPTSTTPWSTSKDAREILDRERDNIVAVVGTQELHTMTHHLTRYEQLLGSLEEPTLPSENIGDIEGELREHGAKMVTEADQLLAKERQTVDAMLVMSQRIPLAFLLLLILFIVYFAIVVARQVLRAPEPHDAGAASHRRR